MNFSYELFFMYFVDYDVAGCVYCFKCYHLRMWWENIEENKMSDWLIVDDGWTITGSRLLLNDVNELEGAADGCVRVRPFGALKVTNL